MELLKNILRSKRVIFVFSDPAGAKAMLAAWQLCKDIIGKCLIISDRVYPFFCEMNADVTLVASDNKLFSLIDFFKPDLIFTGTSLPVSLELKSIEYARQHKITSGSFVDHWTNLRKRFISSKGELILPNFICLIDRKAFDLATKEGLSSSDLLITSNPYYDWLSLWKPTISPCDIYNQLKINDNTRYLVYAPEPIHKFKLKDKYGFDEYEVLKDIDEGLKLLVNHKSKDIKLVFKLHPNVDMEEAFKMSSLALGRIPDHMIIVSDIDFNHLIYYSSGIIGFFSNSLIEAKLLRVPTFRILYKLKHFERDPLEDKEVGEVINKKTELFEVINKLFYK